MDDELIANKTMNGTIRMRINDICNFANNLIAFDVEKMSKVEWVAILVLLNANMALWNVTAHRFGAKITMGVKIQSMIDIVTPMTMTQKQIDAKAKKAIKARMKLLTDELKALELGDKDKV